MIARGGKRIAKNEDGCEAKKESKIQSARTWGKIFHTHRRIAGLGGAEHPTQRPCMSYPVANLALVPGTVCAILIALCSDQVQE